MVQPIVRTLKSLKPAATAAPPSTTTLVRPTLHALIITVGTDGTRRQHLPRVQSSRGNVMHVLYMLYPIIAGELTHRHPFLTAGVVQTGVVTGPADQAAA